MAEYTLENEKIAVKVNSLGAELKSLISKESGREYMWCGDAHFWGRTSPILFPAVGCYKDMKCTHKGKEYQLEQHGFARDMEFSLLSQSPEELWLRVSETKKTLECYPFAFVLDIGYRLREYRVEVLWRVHNPAEETMYFSIGGHPGFCIPADTQEGTGCYLYMNAKEDKVVSRKIKNRLAVDGFYDCKLENGMTAVTKELFAEDALVLEDSQVSRVALLDAQKKAFLEVDFAAPLVGIWAPAYLKEKAPFVCIEPWYGRCDHENFNGTLSEREWGNCLKAKETFEASYTIEIFPEGKDLT